MLLVYDWLLFGESNGNHDLCWGKVQHLLIGHDWRHACHAKPMTAVMDNFGWVVI